MKIIQTLNIIGILLLIIGCQMEETEKTSVGNVVTLTTGEVTEKKGLCILTATADRDGYFLILDKLFSEGIPCDTNDDCYDFLLKYDDRSALAPEFHAYLDCEEREDTIPPNKMKLY